MKTTPSRKPFSSIPGYSQNAVLQLIIASGTGFITYHMIRVILILAGANISYFNIHFVPNITLTPLDVFISKPWTVFTYGWIHEGFWNMFTNMVWLYAFGSIVQSLVGYRQVIPLFIYALVSGALFYELSQLFPSPTLIPFMSGAQAGVVGLAVAAITLSPSYRIYFGEHLSIHIAIVTIIFFALLIMNTNLQTNSLFMLSGGAFAGFAYVKLIKAGYQPGIWVYRIFDRLNTWATPNEKEIRMKRNVRRNEVMHKMGNRQPAMQKKIDDILDKINQKGYDSLTKEEKEILMNAGKDNTP